MFTGIIEEVGMIKEIKLSGRESSLGIQAAAVLEGTAIGDSIAVNGMCLTVTRLGSDYFYADVMNETLKRTGLKSLKRGSRVNLERALSLNSRLGGHLVSGHIDGTGRILEVTRDDIAYWYEIAGAADIMKYIVEKGSIAVDGISLTVAKVKADCFSVSVIPHTRSETVLAAKGRGDEVNLECDLIGKYVERLLGFTQEQKKDSRLSLDYLMKNGF